jgi:uncharacterized membrane protein
MSALVVGLLLFLGTHSVRVVADGWRSTQLARLGERPWKGLYALLSLAGFALLVWGYGQARQRPLVQWQPPAWAPHAAAALTLLAFVLVAAAYVPANHLKARLGHPMLAGTKAWAIGHLLANGTLADLVLFGSFLIWSVAAFASARRRDRRGRTVHAPGSVRGDVLTVAAGTAAWAVFAFALHGWLIGVRPFG